MPPLCFFPASAVNWFLLEAEREIWRFYLTPICEISWQPPGQENWKVSGIRRGDARLPKHYRATKLKIISGGRLNTVFSWSIMWCRCQFLALRLLPWRCWSSEAHISNFEPGIKRTNWKQMASSSSVSIGVINFLKFLSRQMLLYWVTLCPGHADRAGVALFAKAGSCICSVAVSAQLGHSGPGPGSAQTHANIFAKIMSPNVIILLKVFERRRGGQPVNVKFVRGFHLFSIWIIVILLSSLNSATTKTINWHLCATLCKTLLWQ